MPVANIIRVKLGKPIKPVPKMKEIFVYMTSFACFLYINFFTIIITSVFVPFQCQPQQIGPATMVQNASESCYTDYWRSKISPFIFFLILYVAVIPAVFFFILYKNTAKFEDEVFMSMFGSLYLSYKVKFFYWELVVLLKRAVFVVALSFLWSSSYGTRSFVCIMMLFVFLALDVSFFPYQNNRSNKISLTWQLTSIVVLMSDPLVFNSSSLSEGVKSGFSAVMIVLICLVTALSFLPVVQMAYARHTRTALKRFTYVSGFVPNQSQVSALMSVSSKGRFEMESSSTLFVQDMLQAIRAEYDRPQEVQPTTLISI
eukprot:TRINITY_DN19558_c0_g1_i1.p1 TRINITY_DN19558_c0_g1~~TRINITY_DN19558_c0_g1_i1.p1  ORF type:complete len:315 (-),score=54.64 TRINITY_DN19558_c0_g1_i1:121-1065(-)